MSDFFSMKNWSTDTTELKKDKDAYAVWRCEQLINYGLDGEKLDQKLVKRYWHRLHLDPEDKKFIAFLLWPSKKQQSLLRRR